MHRSARRHSARFGLWFVCLVPILCTAALDDEGLAGERQQMLAAIVKMTTQTSALTGVDELAPEVLSALERVPRHHFVPPALRGFAYHNRPLPIGEEQTISQPFIVALMSHLARVERGARVLEVGTGSGYQAAVLAELGARVYSIEIIPTLARQAADTLRRLGYTAIILRSGDGYNGWPDAAPFDAIVVTAAAPHLPQPLMDQLKPGGTMVIPVDHNAGGQQLLVLVKNADGEVRTQSVLPVLFVPLTRADEQ